MKEYIIEENKYNNSEHHETLFSLANGFMGFRGSSLEEESISEGFFINGFFEEEEIIYSEKAYGFPETNERMLNIPNPININFSVDGEKFDLNQDTIKDYSRKLFMRKGYIEIKFVAMIDNKELLVNSKILVSFDSLNHSIVEYSVVPINFSGEIEIISFLNSEVQNKEETDDPRLTVSKDKLLTVKDVNLNDEYYGFVFETTNTKKNVNVYEKVEIIEGALLDSKISFNDKLNNKMTFNCLKGEQIKIIKNNYISLESISKIKSVNYDDLFNKQEEYLDEFWEMSKVVLNDKKMTQGLNFNLFHLLQSVGKDGMTSISAKGLTGEGYEGHYFWDTEIFIFPFFLFTKPELAKNLLIYRYSTLEQGKLRAKELGAKQGAKFSWRTISGVECSGYFPAGTAQYHINADIGYAIDMYYSVTKDKEFMLNYGIEMLVEISKFFLEVGHFDSNDFFNIDGVTGPDEYTAIVNNNYYTNKMVKYCFEKTYKVVKEFGYGIDMDILEKIELAYKNMYLPYSEEKNINPQDDSFLSKEKWDFEDTPKDKYPLLLNFHPLKIYRHQVCKQADVCLADFLVGDDSSYELKKNNFEYYIDITTHDSSLSYNTYSIMACEIDKLDKAFELYKENVRLDLDNSHDNSHHGIHTAAMGGSWLGLVFGFGGMRLKENGLHFNPKTSYELSEYEFRIKYQGCLLEVCVDNENLKFSILDGNEVSFYVENIKYNLNKNNAEIMI